MSGVFEIKMGHQGVCLLGKMPRKGRFTDLTGSKKPHDRELSEEADDLFQVVRTSDHRAILSD